MFERAMAATGNPDLPLLVGESLKIRHLGMLGYVVMSCGILLEVAAQLERYLRLVGEISNSRLLQVGDRYELHCLWPQDCETPPAIEQSSIVARLMFARWLTDRPDLRWQAHFRFPQPRDLGHYRRIFGVLPLFGQPQTKLVLPASDALLPVVMANPQARRIVEAEAEAMLQTLAGSGFVQQLRDAVAQRLMAGEVTIAAVAESLHLSTRTLQRRLDEQGCSFRTVVEDTRRAKAEEYLQGSRMSLSEVAFMLGYSEQSTFQQAFKRWTGMTPGEFRGRAVRPPQEAMPPTERPGARPAPAPPW
jgi:AraC-like DNA-binding protein